jgi:hypothetical protein
MKPLRALAAALMGLALAAAGERFAVAGVPDLPAVRSTLSWPFAWPGIAARSRAIGPRLVPVQSDPSCPAGAENAPVCGGFGSGLFVTAAGEILTSAHVIDGCARVAVRGSTGTIYLARPAAVDTAYDLAILRVTGAVPAIANFGQDAPSEPALITVIGFPENRPSLQGATPALGQLIASTPYTSDRGLIAFTAPVVRGNSGGPIVDQSGAVVGVVYAQYNQQRGVFLGIGVLAARSFMDRQAVKYSIARSRTPQGMDRIIRDATAYTVFVQCLA